MCWKETRTGMQTKLALGLALFVILFGGAGALAGEPETDWSAELSRLKQRLADQDRKIAELEHQAGNKWLDERRAEQVKTLIREVLADAETRASLLEGDMTAGHNGSNFYLASADGKFLMKVAGMLQTRYIINLRDESGDDDGEHGFENSRVRFGFKGHIIDPSWTYFIWTGHGSSGSYLPLDAWIKKTFDNGISIQVGAFKSPFFKEYLISETKQQFVERSVLASKFIVGYSEGVTFGYGNEKFHAALALTDGTGGRGTPATGDSARVEGLAVTARGEVLLAGKWKQFADFQGWRGDDFGAMFGGAVHFQQGEYGTDDDESRNTKWTIDGAVELQGANIFAAVVGNHVSDVAGSDDLDQLGVLVQGGVFLTERFEVFARYEWGDADKQGTDNLSIVTVGGNWFVSGHRLKFTFDVGYSCNEIDSEWSKQGWQADAAGEEGQVLIRTQVQLLF